MFVGSINLIPENHHPESNLKPCLKEISWPDSEIKSFLYKNFLVKLLSENSDISDLNNSVFVDTLNHKVLFIEGEIYNLEELRKELNLNINEKSKPYIVYKAFLIWGELFANRINGDFSIIISNPKKCEYLCYRDHVGIRPLAISVLNNSLYFSSDPMGLCKALYKRTKISTDYLVSQFTNSDYFGYVMPHDELVKVKPCHYMKITQDKIQQLKYWFPENIQTDFSLSQRQMFSDLNQLLVDAVDIRCDKNKVAGAHLSSGLDSGIVAALARPNYVHQKAFYGFSWSPGENKKSEEVSHDERLLIDKIAKINDITPVYSSIDYNSYSKFFYDWRHPSEMMYERKTIDAAKSRGVNMILSGWGGDDFISVGNKGIDVDLIMQMQWKSFLKKYPLNRPKGLLRSVVYNVLFPSARKDYLKYKCELPIYPYLKNAIGKNMISKSKRFKFTSRRHVHLQLLKSGHLQSRTSDWYVFGERHGVEYRYPLLDKRIIEYMIKVPSHCLVGKNHHRIILRELGKNKLPVEVLKNKSKDDPLKSQKLLQMAKRIKTKLIGDFDDFKNNPDLNFVDFDLLEKKIPTILNNINQGQMRKDSAIFFYLKNVHEFTKGYYN